MPSIMMIYIFMTSLFASLLIVPFLHRWALDWKMFDEPDGRKVHNIGIPRIGGIAISMAFFFALLVFSDFTKGMRGILAGSLIIFVTGLVDDLYGITPKRKFFGEICAVLTTMVVGHFYIRNLGDLLGTGEIILPFWLAVPFTLVAIVGVVNAFNLIDGLDGLAGGVAVITLVTFGLLAYHTGNNQVLIFSVSMLGGIVGFLKFNFYPAKIFMGDAGSLVVGYVISFLGLCLTQEGAAPVQAAVPLLVIGLPVADAVWVMIRRFLNGQNPFLADRTHVHHKFLALGIEHRYTVILIYGISLFWSTVAVIFHEVPPGLLLSGYVLISLLFYLTIRFLLKHRGLLRFIGHDSPLGIRESMIYRRIAEKMANLLPLLQFFIAAYLILAIRSCEIEGNFLLKPLIVLLIACSSLIFLTRDSSNNYVLAMYYGAGMAITYVVTSLGGREFCPGLSIKYLGDLLLLSMAFLTLLRFIFRRKGEFYLTSIDFLLLGLSLFLAVLMPQLSGKVILTGVLVRGIIFYSAIKVIASQGKQTSKQIAFAILSSMLVMVVLSSMH